jgi:hypothetical protein
MIAKSIGFTLRNLPAVLFVIALLVATARQYPTLKAERYLAWLLFLPIGVTGLWAGVFHVFFPTTAAAHIGWQVSPFQFEVGMADLAIGVTSVTAFWRGWEFKAAAVCAASIFLLGDAVGHVREMVGTGNFAPGNAGVPFYMDLICPLLAIALLFAARSQLFDKRHDAPSRLDILETREREAVRGREKLGHVGRRKTRFSPIQFDPALLRRRSKRSGP